MEGKFNLNLSKPLTKKEEIEILKMKLEEAIIRNDEKVIEYLTKELEEYLNEEETTE